MIVVPSSASAAAPEGLAWRIELPGLGKPKGSNPDTRIFFTPAAVPANETLSRPREPADAPRPRRTDPPRGTADLAALITALRVRPIGARRRTPVTGAGPRCPTRAFRNMHMHVIPSQR